MASLDHPLCPWRDPEFHSPLAKALRALEATRQVARNSNDDAKANHAIKSSRKRNPKTKETTQKHYPQAVQKTNP